MKFKCAYCGEEEEWYNTEDWVYYDEEDKRYCPACVQKLISAGLYFWRMKPYNRRDDALSENTSVRT